MELRYHLFWKRSQIHSNQLRFFPCCVPTAPSMSFYYNPSHVILKLYLPLSLIKASEQSLPAARSPLTVSSSHTEPQLVQLQGASFPHGPQGCATRWPQHRTSWGPESDANVPFFTLLLRPPLSPLCRYMESSYSFSPSHSLSVTPTAHRQTPPPACPGQPSCPALKQSRHNVSRTRVLKGQQISSLLTWIPLLALLEKSLH